MPKSLLLLLFSLILLIFSSCERGTTITYKIQNESGETMDVYVRYVWVYTGKFKSEILPGNEEVVLILDKTGQFEPTFRCGDYIDSIGVALKNNDDLKIDLYDAESWDYNFRSTQESDIHTCVCQLDSLDFN